MTDASPSGAVPALESEAGKPGRRRCPQTHDAILDATLDMLREVGYSRLTVEGVAARARLPRTVTKG